MAHGSAALIGVLIGVTILILTQSPSSKSKSVAGNKAFHSSRSRRRSLVASTTTSSSTYQSSLNLWPGAAMKWRVEDDGISFEITTSPAPTWFALGFVSPENKGNMMIGPPASEAVAVTLDDTGAGAIGHILLDGMPPKDLTLKPLTSCKNNNNNNNNNNVNKTNTNTGCSKESVVQTGDQAVITFKIIGQLGQHTLPGTNGTTHTMIWAYGESDGDKSKGILYHTSARKGSHKDVNFNILSTAVAMTNGTVAADPVPYYEMHGGSLATIWSVTTLLGGIIARYFRKYKWWIDAHQMLQTVATILSLPLTVLSYLGKGGSESSTHYTSVHGLFGIIFATAASAQGTLGSLAHASFIHQFGIRVTCHGAMHAGRLIHRTLGKVLLIVATAQIMLGLQWYDPEVTTLTHAFVVYASIMWCTVIVFEVRHQTRKKTTFNHKVGSGFLEKKDLALDLSIFDDTVEVIDKLLALPTPTLNPTAMARDWILQNKATGAFTKLQINMCSSRTEFLFAHKSMSTPEALEFAEYVVNSVGATLASTCEEKAMDRTAATRAYSEIVSQWKLIEKRVSTTKRLSPAPPNLTKVEPKSTNADDTEVEL